MLLLNINKVPYMGNPMAPSHLTWSDLESQSQGQDFKILYLVQEPS